MKSGISFRACSKWLLQYSPATSDSVSQIIWPTVSFWQSSWSHSHIVHLVHCMTLRTADIVWVCATVLCRIFPDWDSKFVTDSSTRWAWSVISHTESHPQLLDCRNSLCILPSTQNTSECVALRYSTSFLSIRVLYCRHIQDRLLRQSLVSSTGVISSI